MVEKYIKELLYFNDCVIVPGFGGFVCNYAGAEISVAKNKISPPNKKIAFNDKLTNNDRSLAMEVANGEHVSLEEAEGQIKHFVIHINDQLYASKQYSIEHLGKFSFNTDQNIQFEQYSKTNYWIESFGLPDLYFKPIDRTQNNKLIFQTKKQNLMAENIKNEYQDSELNSSEKQYDNATVNEDGDTEEFVGRKRAKQIEGTGGIYYVLAVFVFLFVMGTTYYLNMNKETYAIGSFSPLDMFGSNNTDSLKENKLLPSEDETPSENIEPTYSEETQNEQTENLDNQNQTEIVGEQPQPESISEPAASNEITDAITSQTGRFYIIAGSFKKGSKAVILRAKLSSDGQSPKIIAPTEDGASMRVSIGDFGTYDEAVKKKNELLQTYGADLWILTY